MWHTVGVDLIGPLTETARGNKYIITATCQFSKWPEAAPLKDKKAEGVAEFLFKCFTRHGCCKVKITDQGREFVNKVINIAAYLYIACTLYCTLLILIVTAVLLACKVNDELCRLTGVECRLTTAYHPQTNGLDERFNQTLYIQRQLLKFIDTDQTNWDLYIDSILFSYRVSR